MPLRRISLKREGQKVRKFSNDPGKLRAEKGSFLSWPGSNHLSPGDWAGKIGDV